jgi:hypothetical protein
METGITCAETRRTGDERNAGHLARWQGRLRFIPASTNKRLSIPKVQSAGAVFTLALIGFAGREVASKPAPEGNEQQQQQRPGVEESVPGTAAPSWAQSVNKM